MSDSKIVPPVMPRLDWDNADPGIDKDNAASAKPDASFHDDHIGSHIKGDEAAKARLVNDRFVADVPRRIVDAQAKVTEAAAFRPAQEDEAARRADRETRHTPRRKGRRGRHARRDPRTIAGGVEPGVDRVEDKIQALWGDLEAITQLLDEAAAQDDTERQHGQHESDQQQLPDDEAAAAEVDVAKTRRAERARLAERQLRLETDAKQQLQLLLAGGVGLNLAGDPRSTFRRLFDRIEHWPAKVSPGKRPQTDEEFNIFLAYVFAPPASVEKQDFW